MSSMYETIRELPLFKGIGEEQLSQMLEKTSMEFLKFDSGDIIHEPGEKVTGIDFILNGIVILDFKLENFDISINVKIGRGGVVGALHLYGINTSYLCAIRAEDNVSLMRLEKLQYLNVLQSNPIYTMNFVNYISAPLQKNLIAVLNAGNPSIQRSIETMISGFIPRHVVVLEIKSSDKELARYCGVSVKNINDWKRDQEAKGYLKINEEGIMFSAERLKEIL